VSRSSIIALCVAVAVLALFYGGVKLKEYVDHERRVDGWTRVIENDPSLFGYED